TGARLRSPSRRLKLRETVLLKPLAKPTEPGRWAVGEKDHKCDESLHHRLRAPFREGKGEPHDLLGLEPPCRDLSRCRCVTSRVPSRGGLSINGRGYHRREGLVSIDGGKN